MTTIEQALIICANRISKKEKHENYDRANSLRKQYKQLITGENQDDILNAVFKDLDADELTKLKNITYSITGSISNSLMFAFAKVFRTEPNIKKIDFEKDKDDVKKKAVEAKLAGYYGTDDLDMFIEKRFHHLSFLDPNAFIVTEYGAFNPNKEKPSPYPWEVSSELAVNYEYKNNTLQFLLVEQKIKYVDGESVKDGIKLTIYLQNDAIVFEQVAAIEGVSSAKGDFKGEDSERPSQYVSNQNIFNVKYYEHKQGRVPAQIVGYIPDKESAGVCYVNPFHYGAVPHLMKSIKSVAEMDITANRHAFPQKLAYVEPCTLDQSTGICNTSGKKPSDCKICGGTALPVHSSSKDVVRLKLPRDPQDMLNLEQLLVYKYPPVEGLTWMREYIKELTDKCYKSVFNSEVFSRDIVVQTATQKTIELQNVYDVLNGYAARVASFWKFTVVQVATVLDYSDVIATLRYPKDFKLKTVSDLLADLKTAIESNAPDYVTGQIEDDIAEAMYVDKPAALQEYYGKKKLFPFAGRNKEEILMGVNANWASPLDAVTWMYFDSLIEELKAESMQNAGDIWKELLSDTGKALLTKANKEKLYWYFDLPYDLQRELLAARAAKKMEKLTKDETKPDYGGGAAS